MSRARVFRRGVGKGWRANRLLVDGQWAIDTRRACAHCERSYRDCACGDVAPDALDLEVA